ncbi:MAG: WD40 repeat domain-containing protein [Pirellulales bacterium]|nr:WD40 repeat domain-containing protein [Pirellulales bacterium]
MSRMTRGNFLGLCAAACLVAECGSVWSTVHADQALPQVLPRLTIQHLAELPADRAPVVTGVALSPDLQTLATAGDDHIVRLWNLADGQLHHTLKSHTDWVRGTVFHPAGQILATAGDDRQVRLWQVNDGQLLKTLPAHPLAIRSVGFCPAGNELAAAGFAQDVRIYDVTTGNLNQQFAAASEDLRAVAFSRDGSTLAAGGRDGRLQLWRLSPPSPGPVVIAHTRRLRAMAFSPSGAYLATAGDDQQLQIWNLAAGMQANPQPIKITIRGSKIMALAWCGEKSLAAGGSDNLIHLFDTATQSELAILRGHTGTIAALAADDAGRLLVSGSFDTTARVWNMDQILAGSTTAQVSPRPAIVDPLEAPAGTTGVLPPGNSSFPPVNTGAGEGAFPEVPATSQGKTPPRQSRLPSAYK